MAFVCACLKLKFDYCKDCGEKDPLLTDEEVNQIRARGENKKRSS